MKRIVFISALFFALSGANCLWAQEIPEDVRAKIVEAAKKDKKAAKNQEEWVQRQIEAWETIQNTTLPLPKAELKKIKEEAQTKFPWVFAKQETYILTQAEALVELYELKANFDKAEFDSIFQDMMKKYEGNRRKVADNFGKVIELKDEIKNFAIEGVDATTLSVLKFGVAKQFPLDFQKQIDFLNKQTSIYEIVANAKEEASKKLEKEKAGEPKITKTEAMKTAETYFKEHTLTVTSNDKSLEDSPESEKTGTGLVVSIRDNIALLFPAALYSPEGLTISDSTGQQETISTSEVYSAKNAPFMLVFLRETALPVKPIEFSTISEARDCIGKDVVVIGYFGANLRPTTMRLTKIVQDNLILGNPIHRHYLEGSLIINPETNKPIAICVKGKKKLPRIDFTSRRIAKDYERALNKDSRFLDALRADIPIQWEAVKQNKMDNQLELAHSIKEFNCAIASIISGSLESAKGYRTTENLASKYLNILSSRMNIAKVRVEYRSMINEMLMLVKRKLKNVKTNELYANSKISLDYHLEFTSKMVAELQNELKKNSTSLAPKEFKKAFED